MENKEKLKEIIAGCLQNKRKAQQELFQFFYGRMLTVCLRYTNDRDTAQEVLQELQNEPFFTKNWDKILLSIIPDIESVNWGRGVGYSLNEFVPPADLGAVSATAIRNGIKEGNDEWKSIVDKSIHEDVIKYLTENNSSLVNGKSL